jgi:hypothetical protein
VQAQQEFHNLYQGDHHGVHQPDEAPRRHYDVDAAITDQALIINVLRDLNSDYSSAITFLSDQEPTPSFLYTRSYLL